MGGIALSSITFLQLLVFLFLFLGVIVSLFYFYWSICALQCCVALQCCFCCPTKESVIFVHISSPSSIPPTPNYEGTNMTTIEIEEKEDLKIRWEGSRINHPSDDVGLDCGENEKEDKNDERILEK